MGISIHYKGKLKSEQSLPDLIEEVKDIAQIHHWHYHILEQIFPENHFGNDVFNSEFYGIIFSPPECEPIQLTFISNGEMRSPWTLGSSNHCEDDPSMSNLIFTKTHHSGPTIHKLIIHLFDYLSKKYFSEFKMIDEAQYWETKDEQLLLKNFNILDRLINAYGTSIESNSMKPEESFEEYILRIAKEIHGQQENDK
jgi:hypothetical protein